MVSTLFLSVIFIVFRAKGRTGALPALSYTPQPNRSPLSSPHMQRDEPAC